MKDRLLLKRLFHSIVNGYSKAVYKSGSVYVKHFTLNDQVDLDAHYQEIYDGAKKDGLPTEEEIVEQMKRMGFWKDTDEKEIEVIEKYIERLNQSKGKQTLQSQIDATQALIEKEQSKLAKKLNKKTSQIGNNCEKMAAASLNEYFIYKSFYRDVGLTIPFFSETEFDQIEDDELNELTKLYNEVASEFNSRNIKLICLQAFFQNYFYLTDNLADFWGKPIIQLTSYQSELSAYGRYFKQLLQNTKDIPEEIRADPEKLVDFVSSSNNIKKEVEEKGENAIAIVGATKEDLKAAGMETANPLALHARKKKEAGLGGLTTIEMQQITAGKIIY